MTEVMELFETHLRDIGEGRVPLNTDPERPREYRRKWWAHKQLTDDEQRERDAMREGK